jgi:preprotein translocase subunit SecB
MADEADTMQTSNSGNGADTAPQIALISQYV